MAHETFYRLLHSVGHKVNWDRNFFFSSHRANCGQWMDLFRKGVTDIQRYELSQPEGQYTASARTAYLRLAPTYRDKKMDIWSLDDLHAASLLDGVCAFRDMKSLHHYASESSDPDMLVATFLGCFVSKIPESHGMTGAQVNVVKKLTLVPYHSGL